MGPLSWKMRVRGGNCNGVLKMKKKTSHQLKSSKLNFR